MCCYSNKDDCRIKKTKQIIRGIVGGIIALYVCLLILVNIPFIQKAIGSWTADALSKQLNTEVTIGRVDFGFLNRLIIDDLCISDQQGKTLLQSDRAALRINLLPLFKGQISISNAQLFGLKATLEKETPEATPNYQFIIDALSSKDKKEKSPLNLRINSFIMRRGQISYDIKSEPHKSTFDINHLNIENLDATISLNELTDDSLNMIVKRLNFVESNCGLNVKNIRLHAACNDKHGLITDVNIKSRQSSLYLDTLTIGYPNYKTDKEFSFKTSINDSFVTLNDFACFNDQLKDITAPLYLTAQVEGTQDHIGINECRINTDDNSIVALFEGTYDKTDEGESHFYTRIDQLSVNNDGKSLLTKTIKTSESISHIIDNLGSINYNGEISKADNTLYAYGLLDTDAGDLDIDASITDKHINGTLSSNRIDIGQIISDEKIGSATFSFDVDCDLKDNDIPDGTVKGVINSLVYADHEYSNIDIDVSSSNRNINGTLSINDQFVKLFFDGQYNLNTSNLNGYVNLKDFNPHALNLTDKYTDETYSMAMNVDLRGKDINSLMGTLNVDSVLIKTSEQSYALSHFNVNLDETEGKKDIMIRSDFVDAHIDGNIRLDEIVDAFQNQIAHHLPSLIHPTRMSDNNFNFDITISESELLKHYIPFDYVFDQPICINGFIDAKQDTLLMNVLAPSISQENKQYQDLRIVCTNTKDILSITGTAIEKKETSVMSYHLTADAKNDQLHTLLNWDQKNTNANPKKRAAETNGMIYAVTEFSDSLGKVCSRINLHKSQFAINDTTWYIKPSEVDIYGKKILCKDIQIYNDEQSIKLNGILSDNPSDSLVANLDNIEVAYITDIVNFHAVRFKGQASGKATISNVFEEPHISASLIVNNLHLQEGRLGTGYIQAFWNQEIKGIDVTGHIVDFYDGIDRTTDVSGFIAPSKNDINLKINTQDTNAEFLNGFLSSTFRDIKGRTNGILNVVGPLNDVNLIGDISADVQMRLRATNTLYHINPADTIHLRPYQFEFNDIRLTDNKNNVAHVNGTLAHKNMKNFKYDFDIDMEQLTIYDEKEFNSDKFFATVFATGNMSLHGSDGHPLRITADITPTKGSVFAYDAATPDAISSTNFVEFRDVTPIQTDSSISPYYNNDNKTELTQTEPEYKYTGDIFMDISIHVNPDCEIKLRMDNVEDGYMSTYGNGTLLAHYHNKSPFSLNGVYQIDGGKYRLYLQDIIYRDLDLQKGSNVIFNGNPFDANIHLICHHTINSVPLRDLTMANTFNQDSKVKVICVLDITGKLGNMNFGFDLQLPNVNDETRQIVKSLISSEEEMNMQMIYLLGLGRFYTNEYARASGESGTTNQAVNTLLSSTISGQINQMLSNVIGSDSKWNFGTGLSTGEKGWNDLDVEGMLSGRLLNDRLLINGNFGYRDNALTNQANFIGDFDIKWRLSENGNTYIKAYNKTNDRYFTKATLNTQGIGITYQRDFDSWRALFRKKIKETGIALKNE